jgi:hypothetical protein
MNPLMGGGRPKPIPPEIINSSHKEAAISLDPYIEQSTFY